MSDGEDRPVTQHSPYPDVAIPELSVTEYVIGPAAGRGNAIAVIDGVTGDRTTYAQLSDQVGTAAGTLAGLGVGPGDVVALMSRNQPAFLPAFHGAIAAGAAVTPLNPVLTVGEAVGQVADSGARLVLVDDATAAKGEQVAREVGAALVVLDASWPGPAVPAGLPARPVGFDPSTAVAALPYSSGTTGRAKGVMLTHHNLVANLAQFAPMWPYGPDDVVCAVLPMFHIYGMNVIMNLALASGSTIVTLPRFDVDGYLATIERHRVTRLHLAPPMILQLVTSPEADRFDFSSVRWAVSGAAPLDAELAARFEKRFGVPVAQGYGMTEASPGTHLIPERDQAVAPAGSIGWLMPNTEGRLVSPETGEDSDHEGEIWVRGPQVMTGYLNNPAATAETLSADGWLRTGDVARLERGAFFIVDRVKELIKYKGYQVAPAELEALLLTHPGVLDAAVVPVPHEAGGEAPKAFVVTTGVLDADELMSWVAERVAPYKRIREIEVIDEIPKSPSGKILRRVLRDRGGAKVTQ
jgi:acyl-CoA synthetase (AMP-forming)/AMP-acid ligase II